ncbi:MAG: hypothetical protein JRJ18_18135 [Deltaproteobacteria bacterium]|nr:hypothetical protein [Deltaproteobacteria bacterium]
MEFSAYQRRLESLERERGWDRVLPSHTFLQCLEGYRGTDKSRETLCGDLAEELADLTAFIFKLASQHGIDMDETMRRHLDKFMERHRDVAEGRNEMARYIAYQERNLERIKGR